MLADLRERLEQTPRAVRPLQHAMLRYQMAMAHAELPTGDRAMNLSKAISNYEEAAGLFNPDRFPVEHARTQIGRGAALRELGEHRQAAQAFGRALELLDPADDETAPEYGAALNNLGLVRSALGDHEGAVEALERAEVAFARAGQPRQRIMALHNLAQAQDTAGDHPGAAATYERALEDADFEEIPYQWGLLHHGLGVALTAMEEPQRAVEAFTASLRVFTRQRYPFQHALARNNLGLAYAQIGDVTSLRRALASYEDALRLFDVRLHREQWEQVYRNLEMAEAALDEQDHEATRAEHFVAMIADIEDDEERIEALRGRLVSVLELPDPQRTEQAGELFLAGLHLTEPGPRRVTGAWLNVLMELPNEQLLAGLQAVVAAVEHLPEEETKDAVSKMIEMSIREELLAPQRIRVRDTLEYLGYERRW